MQITRMASTKYYLLSVLGALMVAVGVLTVSPSAQAQQQIDPLTVDKECNPNPVQVGDPLTCTIDVEPAFPTVIQPFTLTDTFPAGVTVTGATLQQFINGIVTVTEPCPVTGNTVECPNPIVTGSAFGERTVRVTIDAIAQECGTFTNTAEAEFIRGVETFVVTDTEQITVVGCEEAGGVGGGTGGGTGGGAAPITQEGEQESEAGEIDQSFDVS